jgi:predicted CopG family antitoxin
MQKKLTISIDESIYNALYNVIGKRKISRFIEELIKPKLITPNLDKAYKEMGENQIREEEAKYWTEGTLQEFTDEAW